MPYFVVFNPETKEVWGECSECYREPELPIDSVKRRNKQTANVTIANFVRVEDYRSVCKPERCKHF